MALIRKDENVAGLSYAYAKALFISLYGSSRNSDGVPYFASTNYSEGNQGHFLGGVFIGQVTASNIDDFGEPCSFIFQCLQSNQPNELRILLGGSGDTTIGAILIATPILIVFDNLEIITNAPDTGYVCFQGWKFPLK